MKEIRFHGRGGQGTVLASIALAKAFFAAGSQVQTFPLFGVERRGAPVEAYLRIAEEKILIRSNVYEPDDIVVMDGKLLSGVDVTRGLRPGGRILINASEFPENIDSFKGFRLARVDASGIALSCGLGSRTRPIINTAMLGAFSRAFGRPAMTAVEQAILREVPVKAKENVAAARMAYDSVVFADSPSRG